MERFGKAFGCVERLQLERKLGLYVNLWMTLCWTSLDDHYWMKLLALLSNLPISFDMVSDFLDLFEISFFTSFYVTTSICNCKMLKLILLSSFSLSNFVVVVILQIDQGFLRLEYNNDSTKYKGKLRNIDIEIFT